MTGKTILTEVRGFTPVIDEIVQDLGLMPAVVFGRVWRYCQMKDGDCSASLERIATEIGVSRKTVERHIKALCDAGYLVDTTPNRRNRPHHYKDAGKVQVLGIIAAETRSDLKSYQVERSDTESEHSDRESDPGKTESPMKIEKETREDTHADSSPAKANFAMLARICKIDLDTITPTQRGKLNQVEGFMRMVKSVSTQDLKEFGVWWYEHHWKGKDGQPPRPMQIREDWGIFSDWRIKQHNGGVIRV